MRKGIYGLLMGIAFGIFGVLRMKNIISTTKDIEDLNMFSAMWGVFMIFAGVALLVYAIKAFVKMSKFKYPDEK